MAIIQKLQIEGQADFKQIEAAAKRANRATKSIVDETVAGNKKAAKSGDTVVQVRKAQEKAEKRLIKTLESLQKRRERSGRSRVQQLKAERQAVEAQVRQTISAGKRQEDALRRVGREFDALTKKAERSGRASRKALSFRRGGGGGGGAGGSGVSGGGVGFGGLATGAGAVVGGAFGGVVGAAVGVAVAGTAGRLADQGFDLVAGLGKRQARLQQINISLDVLARKEGIARTAVTELDGRIRKLGFTAQQSGEFILGLVSGGVSLDTTFRLAKGALDASVRSGRGLEETAGRLTNGVAKLEKELLDELRIFVRVDDATDKFAKSLGLANRGLLTEAQRVEAFGQAAADSMEKSSGTFDKTIGKLPETLFKIETATGGVKDALAKMVEPAASDAAKNYLGFLESILAVARALTGEISAQAAFTAPRGGLIDSDPIGSLNRDRKEAAALKLKGGELKRFGEIRITGPGGAVFRGGGAADPLLGIARKVTFPDGTVVVDGKVVPPIPAGPPPGPPGRFRPSATFIGIPRQRENAARLERAGFSLGGGPAPGIGSPPLPGGGPLGNAATLVERNAAEAFARVTEGNNRRVSEERRVQEEIRRLNENTFLDLKRQSGDVFDALLIRGRSVWDVFRITGLTALRDIVSSQSAGLLMQLFGGRAPGGGFGFAGVPAFAGGGFGSPGAPGGTSGFAGPVAAFRARASGGAGGARAGGLSAGASTFGASIFGGFGAGFAGSKVPGSGAVKGASAVGVGAVGAFVSGSIAGGASLGTSIAALGVAFSNPLTAAVVGGAIGIGALIGALSGGARKKAREKIRSAYGVTIQNKAILQQVVEIGKELGGSLDAAIQTPAVRELVLTWAMATGQEQGSGLFPTVTTARLVQRGGQLFQGPTFVNGRAATFESRLPVIDISPRSPVTVISSGPAGANGQQVIAENAALIQDAGARAMQASQGRRDQAALLLQPNVAVSS